MVAGTRITDELILEQLATAETWDQILGAHPRLIREGGLPAVPDRALLADDVYPGIT